MIDTSNYRNVNAQVCVFFDSIEDYGNYIYVREKIEREVRKFDAEVADMYHQDVASGYSLNELGHVIDRARYVFGIDVIFEAGSTSWIGWEGMDGRDPDDFGDDYGDMMEEVEKNRLEEEEMMKTWPSEYQRMKGAWERGEEVQYAVE